MSKHKNLCTGVMKFTILVDPSFGIITIYILSLSEPCTRVEKKIFYEILNFTLYTTQNYLDPLGWMVGHEIYNF